MVFRGFFLGSLGAYFPGEAGPVIGTMGMGIAFKRGVWVFWEMAGLLHPVWTVLLTAYGYELCMHAFSVSVLYM